jgi:succinoglycan biosynthesis transport protein ExoP
MSELYTVSRRIPLGDLAAAPTENGSGPAHLDLEPEENTIKEYWGILRRHWLVVLGVVAVCGALAAYKAYNDPPEFRSSAVIRLTDKSRMMAGGLGGQGMGMGASSLGDPILSQIEVLRSRSVTSMVVDALGLRLVPDSPEFSRSLLQSVEIAPGAVVDSVYVRFDQGGYSVQVDGEQRQSVYGMPVELAGIQLDFAQAPVQPEAVFRLRTREHAAAELQQKLLAERRDRTDLIDVGYTAHDPEMSRAVVNTVVERFQAFNAGTAQEDARRRRTFIEGQLVKTDSALRQAQLGLAEFRKRERAFSSRENYAARQAGLIQLRSEREQLLADRPVLQAALTGLARGTPAERSERVRGLLSTPGIAASPAIGPVAEQLLSYQLAYDSLTNGGRARSHHEVQRISELLQNSQVTVVRAIRDHLQGVETRVAVLDNLIGRSEADMQSYPVTDVEEVDLLAEVAHLTTVSGQLRTEYQQAQIDEAVQAGQVEIVDPALAGVPIAAGRIRTILFGLVLGLMLGGGGAVVLENANTTLRRKDEVARVLRIPELAVIPRFVPEDRSRIRLLPARFSTNGKHGPSGSAGELVAAKEPHSQAAEAYRTLRTNLIFSQSLHALRTVVVTSSAPSEGKSTTAGNLAATFAQQGKRVLLVDCDLRKARLHKMFGVPREPGFTHLLLGLKPLGEVVRATPVEGLFFLASGTLPPNPAELVGGEQMKAGLAALAEEFDLVVLDTPPLLAASDAAILGRLVDGVLLVVRAGQTERDAAKQAVRQLVVGRARILGAVLNDPDSKVGKYGGHYQYEYYGEKV